MKPKPERLTDAVTLYEGDCLEVLPALAPGSVDAVVTDPPYGIGFEYASHDDTAEGYLEWCKAWRTQCLRISSGPVAVSCGIANLQNWPKPDWVLCWHKPASMGRCYVGFNNWEPVILYRKPPKQTADVFRAVIKPDSSLDGHPCPKPLEWGLSLVKMLTLRGDTILDPFAGSGPTAIAAMKEGRKCIIIEKDPRYCEIIRRRVREADGTAPGTLFASSAEATDLFAGVKT